MQITPDGLQLATGGGNKQAPHELAIRLWESQSHKEHDPPLTGHQRIILALAYSPDHRHLASAGENGAVVLWDATTRTKLQSRGVGAATMRSVAFLSDGFLAVGDDGTIWR